MREMYVITIIYDVNGRVKYDIAEGKCSNNSDIGITEPIFSGFENNLEDVLEEFMQWLND